MNTSSALNVTNGVPQRSVLGPFFFILDIYNIGIKITHSYFHLYTDNMVIYSMLDQTLSHLQSDFITVQHTLRYLAATFLSVLDYCDIPTAVGFCLSWSINVYY